MFSSHSYLLLSLLFQIQHDHHFFLDAVPFLEEALRMIDELIFFEKNGEVCPANWQKGKKSMKATKEGLSEYFSH